MASSISMYTGLTGLHAHARDLEVIGNNIANVNTTAYKSSRAVLSNMYSRTLREALEPTGDFGGTNPYQVGFGVKVAGTQRNFGLGTINDTGRPGDLAIEGDGFFTVRRGSDLLYTRAGAFDLDSENFLVNVAGDRLQGFPVDSNFQIVAGGIGDLSIPIGGLSIVEQSTFAAFQGNLNASGDLPTTGASIDLSGTGTAGLGLVAGATVPAGPGNLLETFSLLTEIEDPLLPGSGSPLFTAGQVIELNGAQKGTRTLPISQFAVTAASTVQNLMDFLRDALSLHSTGPNPNGATPGLGLNATTGRITITGNTGTVNDLVVDADDLRVLDGAGTPVRSSPFASTKNAAANGESVRTQFLAFDSLGAAVPVDVALTLVARGPGGTEWRYDAESNADTDPSNALTTGRLNFDTSGRLLTTAAVPVSIDLAGTGAASPLALALEFAGPTGGLTALSDDPSEIAAGADGLPFGVLTGFNVDRQGVVVGSFDNGAQRPLGQVVLSTFINPEGLRDEGDDLFRVSANSGEPLVTTPGLDGSGPIIGGALEASNVDLGQEFIKMILASTGYQASSRVIKTADELIEGLLTAFR